ncbi:phosphotransferase [Aquibium microcysteis]|uniref:phosphotransferase n=1 Tax=Aquibium microcysteis TaxID=675281 RepID=UPI00165D1F58|nr:phosphotransferase [Aquibium microcysteis]
MPLYDETSPVRPGHAFDEPRLLDYLTRRVPGIGQDATVRQFRGGQSNPTFLIRSGDRAFVLRKKPPGALLPSAHAVEREYAVMKALAGTEVPVPAMLHLCEDAEILGTAFYVMEGLEGRVFRDLRLPELSPAERGAIYDTMNRTLAALHSVDWRSIGLEGFGRPTGYVSRQVARWTKAYEATRTHEIGSMDKVMPWLARNVPPGDEDAINHGDFRAENMVFHPTEPRVLGVLDWELATIGHPLPDLAYNCLPWNVTPDFPGIGGLVGLPPEHGIPSEAEYVAAYCERTGRRQIDHWDYYVAFSLFRTAAILQGVHARALQGTASNENALAVGRLAEQAADLAWSAAERDGRP